MGSNPTPSAISFPSAQELKLANVDEDESNQPYGKQSHKGGLASIGPKRVLIEAMDDQRLSLD
ncbi:hypothetical protein [Xanthobacter wiegelii]|uniref:hypothetical protein n=1 Tax=Xanthobacter wiegelii TaxID=3119913 RepID=UPI003726F06E